MKYKIIYLYACLFLCACTPNVAGLPIDKCSILGFPGEIYTLISNISTEEEICLTVIADDITINCDGYSINANQSIGSRGIYSKQNNTIIKNCDNYTKIIANEEPAKKALFDIITEIVTQPKNVGEDLIIKVSLINFGAAGLIDANLKYTISNSEGEILKQYGTTIPVKTQLEFLEYINTAGLEKGKYILRIDLTYKGQSFSASTEKVFYIGNINPRLLDRIKDSNSLKYIIPTLMLGILFIAYKKRNKDRIKGNIQD